MPLHNYYLEVRKSTQTFEKKIANIKKEIIAVQILLLFLFGVLSYVLAKNATKPLEESIELLDAFAKDLIHDLNTPVTSIKLNLTLLEQMPDIKKNPRILQRLRKSAHTISELHQNLKILLEEKTFQMERTDLCPIVNEIVEIQKPLYKNLTFIVECRHFHAHIHANAMKQLLLNIIANACRYNHPNGYVKIHTKGRSLVIEDSGIGIDDPEKIFNRNYSKSGSSGLGLDIVKRLAMAMQIGIDVKQSENGGTLFILTMR
ncbi:HAMP domain-containing sensor histidine kinase [Hydrogenimonas sp. SS33]|uniref:sensor histidine kinase n=1 Tax=Hydrogenimonas leucolamina TaxID=2954236 RepID=UPI00336BCCB9